MSAGWALTVATWNIHGAVGADRRYAPARIADVLAEIEADVFALQEVPLDEDVPEPCLAILARATGFERAAGVTCTIDGRCRGNAVLSRFPIVDTRAIDLSFGHREPRGALDADLDCGAARLRVVAVHLGLLPAERRAQIRRLLNAFDTDRLPVILLGDINEWFVWGRPLRWVKSRFEAVPAPASFPACWPVLSLDRIWVHPRHALRGIYAHTSRLARRASDHLPVVARVEEP